MFFLIMESPRNQQNAEDAVAKLNAKIIFKVNSNYIQSNYSF